MFSHFIESREEYTNDALYPELFKGTMYPCTRLRSDPSASELFKTIAGFAATF